MWSMGIRGVGGKGFSFLSFLILVWNLGGM
jgi:hypothetical protein